MNAPGVAQEGSGVFDSKLRDCGQFLTDKLPSEIDT